MNPVGTFLKAGLLLMLLSRNSACSKDTNTPAPSADVHAWTTSADKSHLLEPSSLNFAAAKDPNSPVVQIDPTQSFQSIDGFGFALTGGSAYLINHMGTTEKAALLEELFGAKPNSIGVSYLRISIGASDLDATVFSYDDLPAGQTDPGLQQFSLAKDMTDLIPVLKAIIAINPKIKLMGSPWSPPVWMKDNQNSMGGTLQKQYYKVYADYFVKYVQQMEAQGLKIDAVTPQNEPQHGGNNPSMVFSAAQEADFVKNHLGPAFENAGLKTKIIVWDHNCNRPEYPIEILSDPGAAKYIDGSAFHLYEGEVTAMSTVHNAFPQKNLYFTEQWTGSEGSFDGDLKWHLKNVIIGTVQNWSKIALEWNLANDPGYGPHTPGGCTQCKGAVTINGSSITRNVSYYIVAHASKFVPAGSARIGSSTDAALSQVAFKTPTGYALIALNETDKPLTFNINCAGKWIKTTLQAGTVSTYVWN